MPASIVAMSSHVISRESQNSIRKAAAVAATAHVTALQVLQGGRRTQHHVGASVVAEEDGLLHGVGLAGEAVQGGVQVVHAPRAVLQGVPRVLELGHLHRSPHAVRRAPVRATGRDLHT